MKKLWIIFLLLPALCIGQTIAKYSLDQTDLQSSTVTYDRSGHGNNATITPGTGGFTTDRYIVQQRAAGETDTLRAYDFDGVNTFIDCGTSSGLTASANGLAISVWINRLSTGSMRMAHKGGQSNTVYDYSLSFGTNHEIFMLCSKTTGDISGVKTTTANTILNQWQHILGTYDGASTYKIYVDNVEIATTSSTASSTNIDNLRIGMKNDGTQRYNGKLDDIRILPFNEVDTEAERTQLYNQYRPFMVAGNAANADIQGGN